MRNKTKFFTVLLAVTIFFSCGNISDKKIRIAYANWAEGIAVTYLAKEILSEQGYRIELLNADIAPIFTSLARGKTDVFMDSWLPVTHAEYFRKYNGKLEILGQIYDSARIGLVVPEYVPVHMIEELGGHTGRFSGEIVGIDAGTGIMKCTEKAIPEYGLDYRLMISSGPAMTALLKKAIDKKEWIVVTGWTPHWMFDRFRLRVLEDSRNVYGEAEQIHSIARKGFSKEHPFAAALLGNIRNRGALRLAAQQRLGTGGGQLVQVGRQHQPLRLLVVFDVDDELLVKDQHATAGVLVERQRAHGEGLAKTVEQLLGQCFFVHRSNSLVVGLKGGVVAEHALTLSNGPLFMVPRDG